MAENVNLGELTPEMKAWLDSLQKKVDTRESKSSDYEKVARLPWINMGKKFSQNNNKTYPEMQGSINFLPISYKNEQVMELINVYDIWCPSNEDWSRGFKYKLLHQSQYPKELETRIATIRGAIKELCDSNIVTWQQVRQRSFSLMKGFVLMHRNTKGDLVMSDLYSNDQVVEHKYFPALLVFPTLKISGSIKADLDKKINPVPYAMAAYGDQPLNERKGWVSMTFKTQAGSIQYEVAVSTELVNPVINPEGLIPNSIDLNSELVVKLLECNPLTEFLPNIQLGENGEIFNDRTLTLLESYVQSLFPKKA